MHFFYRSGFRCWEEGGGADINNDTRGSDGAEGGIADTCDSPPLTLKPNELQEATNEELMRLKSKKVFELKNNDSSYIVYGSFGTSPIHLSFVTQTSRYIGAFIEHADQQQRVYSLAVASPCVCVCVCVFASCFGVVVRRSLPPSSPLPILLYFCNVSW